MLSLFIRFWKAEDSLHSIKSEDIELIVPICYGTKPDELICATRVNLEKAIKLQGIFPKALIALSSCSYLFKGSELIEEKFKRNILREAQARFIFAEPLINSMDEAEMVQAVLQRSGICPQGIIIVTGELHSRSARLIYKRVFKGSEIFITCNSYKLEIQEDHLVKSQRAMWRWVISNILRELALRLLPWEVIRKMKHKTVNH